MSKKYKDMALDELFKEMDTIQQLYKDLTDLKSIKKLEFEFQECWNWFKYRCKEEITDLKNQRKWQLEYKDRFSALCEPCRQKANAAAIVQATPTVTPVEVVQATPVFSSEDAMSAMRGVLGTSKHVIINEVHIQELHIHHHHHGDINE